MAFSVHERLDTHGDVERFGMTRTFAGREMYWAHVHVIDGVLVDSGISHARAAFERLVAKRALVAVLTTHGHEDHIGNHAAIPPGVPVHAPAPTVAVLEQGPVPFPFYRRITWGDHGPAPGAVAVGDVVSTGTRKFRVIPTPGHSEDHVSYFDEASGALFTGDAHMGRFRAARDEEDVHQELESLRALADLDPVVMFPGHGPIMERPRERLLDTVQHFESLAKKAHARHDAGWSVRRIRRELIGREPMLTFISSGEFSADKLVRNLLRRRV